MRDKGVLRFSVVCIAAVLILTYNASSLFRGEDKVEYTELPEIQTQVEPPKQEETASPENKTEQVTEKPKENTTVEVSAAAVKGKVISKYISPYSAPSSYNGVYLKNNTSLAIDIKSFLNANLGFKIAKNDKPEVLIMHTHTTETFMPTDSDYYTEDFVSRTTDNGKNMAAIGEIVAKKLNDAGIKTLHDTTQHDYPQYSGSYTRSAKTVNSYLKKYPSIKIVLDLHRDAVSSGDDKIKLVTEINGKKAAQVMLVMGSQSGSVTNYPDWKENFALAVKLQQVMEVKYPTLARPLMLMSKNYNQSLTTGSLLIEFGTDANSLDEALYSASLVGDSLAALFNNLKE